MVLDVEKVTVRGGPAQEVLVGGEGPALVWLHGPDGVRRDDSVLTSLTKFFSVSAPVMPGWRDLSELDGIDTIHDLALHYDSLFEALDLDRIVLVGHSFGGMLAAEIAAHVPKRVRKLVLLSPLGLWDDARPGEDLFARPYGEMSGFLWKGAATPPPTLEAKSTREEEIQRAVDQVNGFGSLAKFLWPIPEKGLRKRLPRIAAETLIVFGVQDAFVPASYAEDFARGIRSSRKLVMSGGHMLPYEQPDKIAAEIAAFIRQA